MIAIDMTGYILKGAPGEAVAVDAVWRAVQGKSLVAKERPTSKIPHLSRKSSRPVGQGLSHRRPFLFWQNATNQKPYSNQKGDQSCIAISVSPQRPSIVSS
jgi:hypothetical protein